MVVKVRGKGAKERYVPLSPSILKLLEQSLVLRDGATTLLSAGRVSNYRLTKTSAVSKAPDPRCWTLILK